MKTLILNELQRCAEKVTDKYNLTTDAWDIWIRGVYLGSIERKCHGVYAIYGPLGAFHGDVGSFMKAISCYIASAEQVISRLELEENEDWIEALNKDPEIKFWGAKKKSLWSRIKGWFK